MEIVVLENKKNHLVFEVNGADHTVCSAIKDELWNDKDIVVAAYSIAHPQTAVPKFILETKTKDPSLVLKSAVDRLLKKNSELFKIISSL